MEGRRCFHWACAERADKRCGKCRAAFYCSQAHQEADWAGHRRFCGAGAGQEAQLAWLDAGRAQAELEALLALPTVGYAECDRLYTTVPLSEPAVAAIRARLHERSGVTQELVRSDGGAPALRLVLAPPRWERAVVSSPASAKKLHVFVCDGVAVFAALVTFVAGFGGPGCVKTFLNVPPADSAQVARLLARCKAEAGAEDCEPRRELLLDVGAPW